MKNVQATGDLTALTEHVLEQAKRSAANTVSRARKEADRIIAQAEEKAKAHAEALVRAGMDEVNRLRKQIISQAQLKLKEELLKEKAEILARISGEIRDHLEELCAKDGEEYLNVLVGLVETALAGEERPRQVMVHLSPRDLKRYKEELPNALKEKLGLSEVKLLSGELHGGVIIDLPDRHLEVDSSLAQLLREFTPRVEELVQREIFAPLAEEREGDNGTDSAEGK